MLRNTKRSPRPKSDIFIEHEGETYIRVSAFCESLAFPVIMAPFRGGHIPVKVQELSQGQIRACGDFSLIERKQSKIKVKDLIHFTRLQHAVAKEALVSPTFDELLKACRIGAVTARHRTAIEEMRAKLAQLKPGPAQKALLEEIDMHELWVDFPLPNDFLAMVFHYAVGSHRSEIKNVTRDMLLEAAILAGRGHDNPADHISGAFTDFNREDINKQAWILLNMEREDGG